MKSGWFLANVFLVVALLAPCAVLAYDTGPHFDITCDALKAEGYSDSAIQTVQVANFLNDFYANASENPFSGYTSWWKEVLSGAFISKENWPATLIKDASRFHFDSDPTWKINDVDRKLDSPELLRMEWDRLARATRAQAIDAAKNNDQMALLIVLGISTHCLQDFYAHTNWVEPKGKPGFDGPGWAQGPDWGSHPTWYDVPDYLRKQEKIYVCSAAPGIREHGNWSSDNNANLATAINKDWPGRPCYQDSYIASYFATRQWVRAVRAWVNNEAFWKSAMNANVANWGVPEDWKGAHEISFYSGLWTGGGQPTGASHPGPGGSLDDVIAAISSYHLVAGKTTFRSKYEKIVGPMASANPPAVGTLFVPSQDLQKNTEFVVLSMNYLKDDTDPLQQGIDPGPDEADFYGRARIAGQDFTSGMIHGEDNVKFVPPLYPFTFIKAVPKGVSVDEPVVNLEVTIETADDLHSGTDDNIYVAINGKYWFNLDLPLYNDFERGKRDTYSIVVPDGLLVKEIDYIRLGKMDDGLAGGWKLGGIIVKANGAVIYEKHGIDTWLEKANLVWQAPDFVKKTPKTADIPVTMSLYDSDGGLYGKDDHCDINLCYGQHDLHVLYNPNTGAFRGDFAGKYGAKTTGGSIFGGEGQDDDKCEMTFGLNRVSVTPAAKLPPPERNEPDSPDTVRVRAPAAPDQPAVVVASPTLLPAVVGARIEGEDAEIVTAWQPPPVRQDMTPFGKEWSNNAQLWYPAAESGGRFAIFLNVSKAGSYELFACLTKGPDYGGVRAALDGSWLGESMDCYAPKVSVTGEVSLGTVELTAGKHDLAFLIQGKSRQSAGYCAGLDYIVLKPAPSATMLETGTLAAVSPAVVEAAVGTGAFQIEGEDAAISGSQAGTTEKQDMSQFGSQWSKNAQLWFRPLRPGAHFTLKLNAPQTRSYALSAYFTKAPDYGMVQVALDGKPLGQPFDGYAAAITRSEAVSLGSVELSTGEHQMSFEVVGKNASSAHYLVGLDLIVMK